MACGSCFRLASRLWIGLSFLLPLPLSCARSFLRDAKAAAMAVHTNSRSQAIFKVSQACRLVVGPFKFQ